jgi:dGTPase
MQVVPRILFEKREDETLAPYALKCSQSKGRKYLENQHPFRTEFQRDRDRIIHSTAFRRLEYKAQVVLNGSGDHFRTRLTHTIEVAGITRTMARVLGLNEDLAEAIALAHDLGHPPFGHPGEHTLNELMQGHGGFEHNLQSLRVVEELETKYPKYRGLNLTFEVRDGIKLGHVTSKPGERQANLEAQVADIADEIAYCCHDVDDSLEHGIITEKQLEEVPIWLEIIQKSKTQDIPPEKFRPYMVRCLIDTLAADMFEQSKANLETFSPKNPEDAQNLGKRLIEFTPKTASQVRELRKFLFQNFYYHPKVNEMKTLACDILRRLFHFYIQNLEELGIKSSQRIENEGIHRAVCDYLAGMTDRYALQMYAKYIGKDELFLSLLGPLETGFEHNH